MPMSELISSRISISDAAAVASAVIAAIAAMISAYTAHLAQISSKYSLDAINAGRETRVDVRPDFTTFTIEWLTKPRNAGVPGLTPAGLPWRIESTGPAEAFATKVEWRLSHNIPKLNRAFGEPGIDYDFSAIADLNDSALIGWTHQLDNAWKPKLSERGYRVAPANFGTSRSVDKLEMPEEVIASIIIGCSQRNILAPFYDADKTPPKKVLPPKDLVINIEVRATWENARSEKFYSAWRSYKLVDKSALFYRGNSWHTVNWDEMGGTSAAYWTEAKIYLEILPQ